MKKRIVWVDIAKFIGIFFVMLSHMELCPSYLRAFFEPFYLAIFFFCSGYCYRQKEDFGPFLKKKVRQLVVPWFIYSNLNIIISNIRSFKHHENGFLTEVFHNLLQIRHFDERLWFIPALFTAYIPFYFVIRSYEKKKDTGRLLIFTAILCFIRKVYKTYMDPEFFPWKLVNLPWHIDYIPTALLFMVLGYLFHERYEKVFDETMNWTKRMIILGIYLVVITIGYFFEANMGMFVHFVFDHFRHILSLAMLISFVKLIPANRYMLYVGQNTLLYFCLHNKVVTLSEAILKKFLAGLYQALENPLLGTVYCFVMTFLISLILLIPTFFINRYLPWTIGRSGVKEGKRA